MKKCFAFILLLAALPAIAASNQYLYKVTLVQAAPGKLLELIDLYKARAAAYQSAGDEAPLWMRHSQGDHWDLLILFPVSSYTEYYQAERVAKRKKAGDSLAGSRERFQADIAWQEDLFAYGPALADLRQAFASGAYFHVEMFVALPGKFADLYQERVMENTYAQALKEPQNFIFVRDQGAAWDIFTIGVFRDLKHYAESADVPAKDQEAAAQKAGFESPSQIGPYLRRFISTHHDTLAVAVK
ncbi:MAG TPA: hypothetical protein VI636_16160 [Candidatus Angelobacter sp.]